MNIVDMHCDTLSVMLENKRQGQPYGLECSKNQITLPRMQQSGYLLQNFAAYVNLAQAENPLLEALELIDLFYTELEKHADAIRPAHSWADIEKNQADGVMSALLTGEEGEITLGKPEYLRTLYRLGMRMMTLTWNYENSLGFPNRKLSRSDTDHPSDSNSQNCGLKEQGIAMLSEMEQLGMIIDVSHLSDAGFYDVLNHTTKPFVASHSNARSICPALRNLTDDMIRKLADRGGITGINFCQDFLGTPDTSQDYLDQAVVHMKYLMNLGGEEFVALGSDFDGISVYDDFADCSVMPKLIHAMEKAGLTPTQIEKICYKNTLRVYRELL